MENIKNFHIILSAGLIVILVISIIYDNGKYSEFCTNIKIKKKYIFLVMVLFIVFLCYTSGLLIWDYKFEHRSKNLSNIIYQALSAHEEICEENSTADNCIKISGGNSIVRPYCNLWSQNNCISLKVNESIFEHTELAKKFIDIIERPCDHTPTNTKLRKSLGCDSNWNKDGKIIVFFYNKQNKSPRYHIITERKDIPLNIIKNKENLPQYQIKLDI